MTKIELIEAPEWHVTDAPYDIEDGPTFEPDITDVDVECALCKTGIGWTEYLDEGPHGEDIEGHRWVEYYEVTAEYPDGGTELEPTKLCEDCTGWVGDVGPDVAADREREQAEIARRSATLKARNLDGQGLHR